MRRQLAHGGVLLSISALCLASCGGTSDSAGCDAVTIDVVRAAVEEIDGYTFSIEGTDQVGTTMLDPISRTLQYEYEQAPIAAEGSYSAPENATLSITDGALEGPPMHSSLFDPNWYPQADRLVQVDGRLWLHTIGQDGYFESSGWPLTLIPNALVPLLNGDGLALQDATGQWASGQWGGALPGLPRTWTTTEAEGECVIEVTASADGISPIPGWDFEFGAWITVDPGTMLPARVRVHLRTPELPDSGQAAVEYDLTYAFAYDQVPDIQQPSPVRTEPPA
jgi:hypothetical protein